MVFFFRFYRFVKICVKVYLGFKGIRRDRGIDFRFCILKISFYKIIVIVKVSK